MPATTTHYKVSTALRQNVVAISKKSLALVALQEAIKQGNMGRNSLKNSNLRVFTADLAHFKLETSLVQEDLQGFIADLAIELKKSPLIGLYKRTLLLELERYDAIPFYLAFLYMILKPGTPLYFGDYAADWQGKAIRFTKNGEVVAYSFQGGLDKSHRITPQTLFSFKPDRESTKGYYYTQNRNLVRVVNFLVQQGQDQTTGAISPCLLYPYLFFNKDRQINQKPKNNGKGNHTNVKYDPQSKLLKKQITVGSRKYRILKLTEVMSIYDGLGDWNQFEFTIPDVVATPE